LSINPYGTEIMLQGGGGGGGGKGGSRSWREEVGRMKKKIQAEEGKGV
jgi:hypothetical protein